SLSVGYPRYASALTRRLSTVTVAKLLTCRSQCSGAYENHRKTQAATTTKSAIPTFRRMAMGCSRFNGWKSYIQLQSTTATNVAVAKKELLEKRQFFWLSAKM